MSYPNFSDFSESTELKDRLDAESMGPMATIALSVWWSFGLALILVTLIVIPILVF